MLNFSRGERRVEEPNYLWSSVTNLNTTIWPNPSLSANNVILKRLLPIFYKFGLLKVSQRRHRLQRPCAHLWTCCATLHVTYPLLCRPLGSYQTFLVAVLFSFVAFDFPSFWQGSPTRTHNTNNLLTPASQGQLPLARSLSWHPHYFTFILWGYRATTELRTENIFCKTRQSSFVVGCGTCTACSTSANPWSFHFLVP